MKNPLFVAMTNLAFPVELREGWLKSYLESLTGMLEATEMPDVQENILLSLQRTFGTIQGRAIRDWYISLPKSQGQLDHYIKESRNHRRRQQRQGVWDE